MSWYHTFGTVYFGGGGDAPAPSTKVQVNKHISIPVMGASIMYSAFDDTFSANAKRVEQLFEDAGVRVKLMPWAVGGNRSATTLAKTPEAIAQLNKRDLFAAPALHTGGNDVTSDGPYPGGAELIASNLNGILDLFDANGNKVIMSPISYRVNQDSAPYNENYVLPIIESRAPDWWASTTKFNLFELFQNNPDLLVSDGIHPTDPAGDEAIQALFIDAVLGGMDYNPPTDTDTIKDVIIRFGTQDYKQNFMGIHRNEVYAHTTQFDVYNKDLTKVTGGKVWLSGGVFSDGFENFLSEEYALTLNNWAVVGDNAYGGTYTVNFSSSSFDPVKTYTVRLTACKASTATTLVGEYTVAGIMQTLDAAMSVAADQEIIEWASVSGADLISSGIYITKQAGSSQAYLSGLEIIEE